MNASPVQAFFLQHLGGKSIKTTTTVKIFVTEDVLLKTSYAEINEYAPLWLKKHLPGGYYDNELHDLSEGIEAYANFFPHFSLQKTGGFLYTGDEEYKTVISFLKHMREWNDMMQGRYGEVTIPFIKPAPLVRIAIDIDSVLLQDLSRAYTPLFPAWVLENMVRWLVGRDVEKDDEYEFALYSLHKLVSWGEWYIGAVNKKYNRLIADSVAKTFVVPAATGDEFCWMRDFVLRTQEILNTSETVYRGKRRRM